MNRNVWSVLVVGCSVLGGCGDSAANGSTSETLSPEDFDHAQEVVLEQDLVVAAGETLHVAPGVTVTAREGVKVLVQGTLVVEGSEAEPVRFQGAGQPNSWHGIVIEAGGDLTLTGADVSDAVYGLLALPGSHYSVSNSKFSRSFKSAVVQSDGSFDHVLFQASTPDTVSFASEVTIDDPNGSLTIMDASPSITDCQFDGSSSITDMVRIGGAASPTFDHVYLHDAHCAFHINGSVNGSPRITNSILENFSYGIMAYTTKPIVEHSVFIANRNDIGICSGATADNAPVLHDNHYEEGAPSLDSTCENLGIVDPSPAAEPNPQAGTAAL